MLNTPSGESWIVLNVVHWFNSAGSEVNTNTFFFLVFVSVLLWDQLYNCVHFGFVSMVALWSGLACLPKQLFELVSKQSFAWKPFGGPVQPLPAGCCWPGLGGMLLSCCGLAFNALLLLAVRARAVLRACLVCAAASRSNCSWLKAHPWLWLLLSCLVPGNGPWGEAIPVQCKLSLQRWFAT